jgi:RNA polymerase sigma-70 factor (ECF subfamily)
MDEKKDLMTRTIARHDEAAFEQVFKEHFKTLHAYAFAIIKEESVAEEVVQQVFMKLWERSIPFPVTGSVAAYLYRAVHNESLNYLKHRKVQMAYKRHLGYTRGNESEPAGKNLSEKELGLKLTQALNDLPKQCRIVFELSRNEGLRYLDIAEKLDISVKTVENQMGKALKILRMKLIDFLPILIVLKILNAIH